MKVKHPLLLAKQRLDKNYVHKSIVKAETKRQRKGHEIVHIDGVRKPWAQFKREFEEERTKRSEKGEMVKNASFILNKDKQNEKLMEWNYRSGFRSEDSDDEMTIYRRSERQFYRKLADGVEGDESSAILTSRSLMKFELMMLKCLGGSKLLSELMGKTIDLAEIDCVFDYIRPQEKFDAQRPAFLQVPDKATFTSQYKVEQDSQLAAM